MTIQCTKCGVQHQRPLVNGQVRPLLSPLVRCFSETCKGRPQVHIVVEQKVSR